MARPNDQQFQIPAGAPSFDLGAFDRAIRDHGITYIHYSAVRCPVGLANRYDTRRSHEDHEGCSNGFIYTRVGEVTALFTSNGKSLTPDHVSDSHVQATLERFYSDNPTKACLIAPFDRLYLQEEAVQVVDWTTYEHHASGIDRLPFPAVQVELLVDSQGVRYQQGLDFVVQPNGQLRWIGNNRPGVDPESGQGLVCSVRYTYRPYWYVTRMLHEVRVARQIDPTTGARILARGQQSAALVREYVNVGSEESDDAKPAISGREAQVPRSGSFGPR
jgi:hypothetical protein